MARTATWWPVARFPGLNGPGRRLATECGHHGVFLLDTPAPAAVTFRPFNPFAGRDMFLIRHSRPVAE